MKNRVENSKAEKPVKFTVEITMKPERARQFARDARCYGLTKEEMASSLIEIEMEGNEGSMDFEEVGYHLMFAAIDLFPHREKDLLPLRDAFIEIMEGEDAVDDARKLVARALAKIAPDDLTEYDKWIANLSTRAERGEAVAA